MEIFTRQKFRQAQLKFHQCGKGRHVLYTVINEGQKIYNFTNESK